MESDARTDVEREIKALAEIGRALDGLDSGAIARALEWAAARYGLAGATGRQTRSPVDSEAQRVTPTDLASAFQMANPTTQGQKVLIATYWYSQIEKGGDVEAQVVNSALKQLGHRLSNVTMVYSELIKARLVMQTAKTGIAKQARKRYRVSADGIRAAKRMLSGVDEDDQ